MVATFQHRGFNTSVCMNRSLFDAPTEKQEAKEKQNITIYLLLFFFLPVDPFIISAPRASLSINLPDELKEETTLSAAYEISLGGKCLHCKNS